MSRIFAITMGDSSGVGPEIVLKAAQQQELRHPVVVYGDRAVLEAYRDRQGYAVALRAITHPAEYREGAGLQVIDHGLVGVEDLRIGQLSALSGEAARAYVVSATRAALDGEVAAVVTLPMNKEATQQSDPGFVGHTELIAELCGARDVTMMLASEQLIVTHVSTHVSLATAIARVKQERIRAVLQLTWNAVRRLRPEARLAVAGLNPHAGENGLFGDEEIREIRPAVEWARQQGMNVEGPLPADTLFYLAVQRRRFDAVVCMYHDQGHIPSKLLDFEGGVNVSLGLPIIRTSVDHGTAFDIAGTGAASTRSLVNALEFAARLAQPQ